MFNMVEMKILSVPQGFKMKKLSANYTNVRPARNRDKLIYANFRIKFIIIAPCVVLIWSIGTRDSSNTGIGTREGGELLRCRGGMEEEVAKMFHQIHDYFWIKKYFFTRGG